MNKKIVCIVFLLISVSVMGQRKFDKEKIKALKVAFITDRLALSSEEAKEFWPLHAEFENKMMAIRHEQHKNIRKKIEHADQLSNEQANTLFKKFLALEKERLLVTETYFKKFSKVLSPVKALQLLKINEDFKRKLLRQYGKRHKRVEKPQE